MCILDILAKQPDPTQEAYDRWVRKQVGTINRHEIDSYELEELFRKSENIFTPDYHAPDSRKRYTDLHTMQRIVPYLTYPAERYISELEIDCDDYALWAKADARRIFHLQSVFEVWGWIPSPWQAGKFEYHAWNVVLVGNPLQVMYFEPNAGFPWAGELFGYSDNGYIPEKWK